MSLAIDFSGKTALVFGATMGIGRATAVTFAQAGANVVFAGRGIDAGRSVETEIRKAGGMADFIEADVGNEADVEAVVAHAAKRFGRIHAAVNNAGIASYGPIHEISSDEFDRVISVNLKGVWLGLKHEIAHMLAQGGGAIVNTSSIAGVTALPNLGLYAASKHGIIGLTRAAALEGGRSGIRVNAIGPGPVETALLENMTAGRVPLSVISANNPLGRISQPIEIARAIVWLCSDQASYVNGHVLLADGGYTAA
jgi:NAD(P)-dependent dehydrogenase (short-subunit alcohol dehydrogenase family)